MMTDEDTPNSKHINSENSPDMADKKGQMLVIYLPEGSVIVDRTDVNLSSAPQAIVERVSPKAEEKVVEPVVEETSTPQMQPTLQEVVQLAVAEALRITGLTPESTQQGTSLVTKTSEANENGTTPFADYPAPAPMRSERDAAYAQRTGRRVHVRRKRRLNWVHGINTVFVTYLLLIAVVPSVLSSAFGVAIYASKVSHPDVLIYKGDLIVSQGIPASQLKANDLILVRDSNSWLMDAREVTSNATSGGLSTIATASIGGSAIDKTYVLANNARSYKVSRVIPKLGYVSIVFLSTIAKVLGGLFILILNVVVHLRRSRRRRLETILR